MKLKRMSSSITTQSNYIMASSLLLLIVSVMLRLGVKPVNGYSVPANKRAAHVHHNRRSQAEPTPTLSVEVGPQSTILPTTPPAVKPVDYNFAADSLQFNFSCIIKNPSFFFKVIMTKQQTLNNGTKTEPIELLDTSSTYKINHKLLGDSRLKIETSESTFDNSRYMRISLIINKLRIQDTGTYKCKYSDTERHINLVVYKYPDENSIQFPLANIKEVSLNKPISLTCKVPNAYPNPVTSFTLKNEPIKDPQVHVSDTSDKNEGIYFYSSLNVLNFTPRYTDQDQFLTCNVLPFGSNSTIKKEYKLNVTGVEIIYDECKDYHMTTLNDANYKITCLFYANPSVVPDWSTVLKKPTPVANELGGVSGGSSAGGDGDGGGGSNSAEQTSESTTPVAVEPEQELKIPKQEEDLSNYMSSIEEVGSHLFKAILRIRQVGEEDIKNYTLKLHHGDKTIERVFMLKTERQIEVVKETFVEPAGNLTSGSHTTNVKSHSKLLVSLSIQLIMFFILFNR